MTEKDDIKILWEVLQLPGVLRVDPTGSRYICDPPPMNTDLDVICLVKGSHSKYIPFLKEMGFTHTSLDEPEKYEGIESYIDCYRFGEINLILIKDNEFYLNFLLATELCKSLNVLDKNKRIEIFQNILYDDFEDDRKNLKC